MNPAAHRNEDNALAPVLYMALELSNKSWRLTFGDGAKRRQVAVPAADLAKLACAVAKAKEHFGMPASARVVSCYEAGRDGFWLHRYLRSVGIENEVIDAASIEVNRRLRHVKTDRLDGERLLAKLIRHHTGERDGWSVVRAPSLEEEDARRLHRELERLKRERLAHRVRMQSLLVVQGIRVMSKDAAQLRLETLTLWDGRSLPGELRCELDREVERLALVERQIAALEAERRERLREPKTDAERSIGQLMRLGEIGPPSGRLLGGGWGRERLAGVPLPPQERSQPVVPQTLRRRGPAHAPHRHRCAGAAIAHCAVALSRRRRDSRGRTAHCLADLTPQGSQGQELVALKVGRSARDLPGPRNVRRRPDRGGASSESGSSCPLGADAASGARPTTPTRIEGGDERIALTLPIQPGQPTLKSLVGKKMAGAPQFRVRTRTEPRTCTLC